MLVVGHEDTGESIENLLYMSNIQKKKLARMDPPSHTGQFVLNSSVSS